MRLHRLLARPSVVLFVALIASVAMAVVVADLDGSETTVAAGGFKAVQGYVYDSLDIPLDGASVKVEMVNKTTLLVTATETTTTGSDGFYGVTFDISSVWEVGDTILVTATYNLNEQSNQAFADDVGFQQIDVHFGTVIPEFGSLFGPVVAVVAIACLVRFRSRCRA